MQISCDCSIGLMSIQRAWVLEFITPVLKFMVQVIIFKPFMTFREIVFHPFSQNGVTEGILTIFRKCFTFIQKLKIILKILQRNL